MKTTKGRQKNLVKMISSVEAVVESANKNLHGSQNNFLKKLRESATEWSGGNRSLMAYFSWELDKDTVFSKYRKKPRANGRVQYISQGLADKVRAFHKQAGRITVVTRGLFKFQTAKKPVNCQCIYSEIPNNIIQRA